MKRRILPASRVAETPGLAGRAGLLEALASLTSAADLEAFLEDLCTPAEIEAMADRWRVIPLLLEEASYREIHNRTGVSVTTIGRVARCLARGSGGYRLAAEHLHLGPALFEPPAGSP